MSSTSFLPEKNEDYKLKSYWDDRYAKEEEYDWLKGYNFFKAHINQEIPKDAFIHQVGVGNSTLAQDMYLDGYTNMVNSDYSEICIEKMKEKFPHLKWEVQDVMNMKVPDATYDVVIDKAVMDALFVDEKTKDVTPEVTQMLSEIYRILKPGGLFVQITWYQAYFRKPYLLLPQFNWEFKSQTVGEPGFFQYQVFTMRKRDGPAAESCSNGVEASSQ